VVKIKKNIILLMLLMLCATAFADVEVSYGTEPIEEPTGTLKEQSLWTKFVESISDPFAISRLEGYSKPRGWTCNQDQGVLKVLSQYYKSTDEVRLGLACAEKSRIEVRKCTNDACSLTRYAAEGWNFNQNPVFKGWDPNIRYAYKCYSCSYEGGTNYEEASYCEGNTLFIRNVNTGVYDSFDCAAEGYVCKYSTVNGYYGCANADSQDKRTCYKCKDSWDPNNMDIYHDWEEMKVIPYDQSCSDLAGGDWQNGELTQKYCLSLFPTIMCYQCGSDATVIGIQTRGTTCPAGSTKDAISTVDCGAPYCGNGDCDSGENGALCPEDCESGEMGEGGFNDPPTETPGAEPPPRECNDGIDNDEDGFIDMDDPSCLDSMDDDESKEPSDALMAFLASTAGLIIMICLILIAAIIGIMIAVKKK
jgi:hypothetical protein